MRTIDLTRKGIHTDRYYYGCDFDLANRSTKETVEEVDGTELMPSEARAMLHLLYDVDGDIGHGPYGRPVVEALEDRGFAVIVENRDSGDTVQLTTIGRMVVAAIEDDDIEPEAYTDLVNCYISTQLARGQEMVEEWERMGDVDEVAHWKGFLSNIRAAKQFISVAWREATVTIQKTLPEEAARESESKTDRAIREWRQAYKEAHGEDPGMPEKLGGGWLKTPGIAGSKLRAGEMLDAAERLRKRAKNGFYED